MNEILAMAPQGTDGAGFVVGAKRSAQEPNRVQVLKPLAVGNVGLSPWQVLDVMSVDEPHVDLALLQDLEQRNPIDAGRFHRHGTDSAVLKPVGQSLQIDGERWEIPGWFRITIYGNRHEHLRCADINPCGMAK